MIPVTSYADSTSHALLVAPVAVAIAAAAAVLSPVFADSLPHAATAPTEKIPMEQATRRRTALGEKDCDVVIRTVRRV